MTSEQMQEICKKIALGLDNLKISEAEGVTPAEVAAAVKWGDETGYFDELKEMWL